MANFKIKQLDVKCGMTIEINGTWTRIDRGLTLENLNLEDIITKKEIMEQFSKAQGILEEDIVMQVQKLANKQYRRDAVSDRGFLCNPYHTNRYNNTHDKGVEVNGK